MLKLLTRSTLTLTALLLLLGTSSALGVRDLHRGTKDAVHHRHTHHTAGGAGPASAVVSNTTTTGATTLLGDEAVEPNRDSLGGGQARAFPFRARVSGTASAVHIYVDSADTATTLRVGLYAPRWHHPGSLLSTGSLSAPVPGAWDTVPLVPTQLVSGGTYWLAVLGTGGKLSFRDRTHGTCVALASAQTNLETAAATWRTGAPEWACPVSAYVTAATGFPMEPPAPIELVPPPTPVESPTPPTEPSPPVETPAPPVETPAPPVETPAPPVETPPPALPAPTDTAPPAISGTTEENQQLTATSGAWTGNPTSYAYQWEACDTAGDACSDIAAATASTYTLAANDVGHTIRVTVTATNAGGSNSAASATTTTVAADPPPPPAAPTDTTLPTISGGAVEGQQLSATAGTWSGNPTSYTYQWQDCNTTGEACLDIAAATSSTYKLATSDVGDTLRVVLTATNAGGSANASSTATKTVAAAPPPPPTNSALPAISGTTVEGDTLSASTGTWSNNPTSYTYQWEDCDTTGETCTAIGGATSPTRELTAGDVGHTLRVLVSATNAGGSANASSTATKTVAAAPPPPPTNSALPAISGTTVEGDTLSASTGTWSNNPTSYTYQWEDCDTTGETCTAIGGATSPTRELTAGDVGHTLRVLVSASNAGGSTKASSAATALVVADPPPPPPPPPTASFNYSPASPVTGQPVTFDGTSSTCSEDPCTYEWSDDGGTTRPIPALWPLGSGPTLSFTFSGAGTKYVRLVVTDTIGRSATVEHNVVVAEAPPPPPVAPSNTGLPAVSGTPEGGNTLTASSGTWAGGAPIGYAYQWEDCNSSGGSCSIIGGATSSTHILASSDVGHTLRVVVKATNSGGTGEATSSATSPVTAKEGTPTDCFENPETEGTERFEACGYPGPKNTGVVEIAGKTECSALPEYAGSKTIGGEKTTIEGKELKITLGKVYGEGGMTVDAKDVTFNNDCFLVKGGDNEGPVIHLEGGAAKFLLENSTIRGENSTTQSYEHAINDFGGNRGEGATTGVVLKKDRLEDCGECLSGTFETVESYLIANESFSFAQKISDESLHRETWYANEETVVARDDTFLVPEWETAIIFDNTNNGQGGVPCGTHVTVENSFLAGSGQMFQTCGHTTNVGTGTLVLKNNRVARCLTMPMKWEPNESDGCSGSAFGGTESHGYYPYGGSQNIVPSGTPEPWTWEGNYWDDNLKTISKAEAEE